MAKQIMEYTGFWMPKKRDKSAFNVNSICTPMLDIHGSSYSQSTGFCTFDPLDASVCQILGPTDFKELTVLCNVRMMRNIWEMIIITLILLTVWPSWWISGIRIIWLSNIFLCVGDIRIFKCPACLESPKFMVMKIAGLTACIYLYRKVDTRALAQPWQI